MQKCSTRNHLTLSVLTILVGVSAAWASSANFEITGQGIALGEAKEVHENGKPLPPQFHANAEVGKPFTLIAQGMALPRGAKAQPCEPDSGSWNFSDKSFKEVPLEKKQTDKTMIVLHLEPTATGHSRVRFTGKVLGYERTFDVFVEVLPAK